MLVRYMDNVPLIIPLLEKELRSATRKLNDINQELRQAFCSAAEKPCFAEVISIKRQK